MPIKHAAFKALRQTKKRQARNRQVKESVKALLKKARKTIEAGQVDAGKTAVQAAIKAIDKSRQHGVMPANAASRKKSRLVRKLNVMLKTKS